MTLSGDGKTTFNDVDMALTYDSANFIFDATNSTLQGFEADTGTAGTLTLKGYGDAVTLGEGAELVLAFTAGSSAAADCPFTLTSAKVDLADHANQDIAEATVTGSPAKVSVVEPVTYKVTFDAKGHGTAPAAQDVKSGEKAQNPGNLTAEGWTFGGWFTDEDCTAEYDFTKEVTSSFTLYAKWTEIVPDPVVTVETSQYTSTGDYTLIKATIDNANGNVPTYDGQAMYKVTNVDGKSAYSDNAYYYVLKTADYNAEKVKYGTGTAETIVKKGDANVTGKNDINDAQFVYNLYNGDTITVTYTPTAEQLLSSDVNGDGSINTDDCSAVVGTLAA